MAALSRWSLGNSSLHPAVIEIRLRHRVRRTIVLMVVAMLFVGCGGYSSEACPDADKARSMVLDALATDQGFQLRPFGIVEKHFTPSRVKLKELRRCANKAIATSPDSNWRHVAALLAMQFGEPSESVTYLQGTLQSLPMRNDLAVAYLQRGYAVQESYDLALGLSELNRCKVEAPDSQDVTFNRAVALRNLFILGQGRAELVKYLQLDKSSRWRRLANEHLRSIERNKVNSKYKKELISGLAHSRQFSAICSSVNNQFSHLRVHAEELMEEWALNALKGTRITRDIEAIIAMGKCLRSKTGDSTVEQAATLLRDEYRTKELAQAHVEFAKGKKLYFGRHIDEARKHLLSAHRIFVAEASPFLGWSSYYLAACDYFSNEHHHALERSEEYISAEPGRSMPVITGHMLWLAGLVHLERSESRDAIILLGRAAEELDKAGETPGLASVYSLIANAYDHIGDRRQAWNFLLRALAEAAFCENQDRASVVFTQAAILSSKSGLHTVAIEFQDEVKARETESPVAIAESLWARGRIWAQAGEIRKAVAEFSNAVSAASKIHNHAIRNHTIAGILVARADLMLESDPKMALFDYESAYRIYRGTEFKYLILDVYRGRAKALISLGQLKQARKTIVAGLEEFNLQRGALHRAEVNKALYEKGLKLLEDLIALDIDLLGDPDTGLMYSEQARARMLLDSLPSARERFSPATSFMPKDLMRKIPVGTVALHYRIIEGRLYVWCLTRDRVLFYKAKFEPSKIAGFQHAIAAGGNIEEVLSSRLYGDLLSPFANELRNGQRIVISPDGELWQVPFAALRNPESGRLVVQEFSTTYTPSLSVYLSDRVDGISSSREVHSLIVADPAFDQARFVDLTRLHEARRQAYDFAIRMKGRVTVLIGENATVDRFAQEAWHASLVLYAGHGVVNRDAPEYSKLIFAPTNDDRFKRGELFASDIAKLDLEGVGLVVLAACESGQGHDLKTESSMSLARSFLSAGAEAVLASLWEVDDGAAGDFILEFQEHLLRGLSASAALRGAQLAFSEGKKARSLGSDTWSAFVLLEKGDGRLEGGI